MNYSMIRYILSSVLGFEGIFLLLPALVAAIYREKQGFIFLAVALCCIVIGACGRIRNPKSSVFYAKEGFAAVSLSWILLSMAGALPFFLTGEIPSYIDALFETISGFTTTGASVLPDVEALSKASAFWRCFTHWIGGMGMLVFVMAILPLSPGSSIHLMRAESPGPSVSKLVPKLKSTAMILYGIYVVITIIEVIALLIAGMPVYDSFTISFSTVGTGGFGILNSNVGSYSMAVQIILTIFMLLCAINFNVYYLLLVKKCKEAFSNDEVKYFLIIVLSAAVLITFNIKDGFSNIFTAFQTAIFEVASIISTTGFVTVDYNVWPVFSQMIILILMFLGACAGSTGGGFKISRALILIRSVKNEIMAVVHPRSVRKVKMNKRIVPDNVVKTVLCYLATYIMIIIISLLLVSLGGFDVTSNFTAVLTTLNNVGPGLNVVGPTGNFGGFTDFSKIVLMLDMLIGRLELFPMLVLFAPGMWKISSRRAERKKKAIKFIV